MYFLENMSINNRILATSDDIILGSQYRVSDEISTNFDTEMINSKISKNPHETTSEDESFSDKNNINTTKLKNITARRRWKILARAIVKEKFSYHNINRSTEIDSVSNEIYEKSVSNSIELDDDAEINLASVRSFDSFDLIKHDQIDSSFLNYKITNNSVDQEFSYNVNIHQIKNREWTAKDLIGFNNTGT